MYIVCSGCFSFTNYVSKYLWYTASKILLSKHVTMWQFEIFNHPKLDQIVISIQPASAILPIKPDMKLDVLFTISPCPGCVYLKSQTLMVQTFYGVTKLTTTIITIWQTRRMHSFSCRRLLVCMRFGFCSSIFLILHSKQVF